jgi:hypothetical protein
MQLDRKKNKWITKYAFIFMAYRRIFYLHSMFQSTTGVKKTDISLSSK